MGGPLLPARLFYWANFAVVGPAGAQVCNPRHEPLASPTSFPARRGAGGSKIPLTNTLPILVAEHLDNMLGQVVLDLSVPWHRLRNTRIWITVPVVLGSVGDQLTTQCLNCPDQVHSLHE